MTDNSIPTLVILDSNKCLKCVHLCGDLGKKEYEKCHVSNGNMSCPAGKIIFTTDKSIINLAERLAESVHLNDRLTQDKLEEELNTHPKGIQDLVLIRANELGLVYDKEGDTKDKSS